MAIPKVIILSEILRGQNFELTKDLYTIGRTENNDICIPDGTMSSHHCDLVRVDENSYIARDMGSTNGTRVNGIKITEQALTNSDILQCGGIEILFDCEDKSNTTSLSTQTNINLDLDNDLDIADMGSVNPFGSSKKKKGGKGMVIAISALAVVAIGLTIALVIKFLGQ